MTGGGHLLFTVSGCKRSLIIRPWPLSPLPPSPPPISSPLFVRRVIRWIRGWATLSEPHERSSRRLYCVLCGARSGVNGRGSTRVCFTAGGERTRGWGGPFFSTSGGIFRSRCCAVQLSLTWKFGNHVARLFSKGCFSCLSHREAVACISVVYIDYLVFDTRLFLRIIQWHCRVWEKFLALWFHYKFRRILRNLAASCHLKTKLLFVCLPGGNFVANFHISLLSSIRRDVDFDIPHHLHAILPASLSIYRLLIN